MIYLIITLAMELLVPIQTAANSRLRMTVGQAYVSTLVSFSVSTLFLLLVAAVAGIPVIPTAEMLHTAPWWSWFGGIIALLTITCAIYLFKELGQLQATIIPLFSQLLLIGQLLLSLLMEQFGWLGAPRKRITALQIVGLLLMVGGVAPIRL